MGSHGLITGGAGFIGSHLADELLRLGHRVRALDNFSPQLHGPGQQRPSYLHHEVELVGGNVRHCVADITRAREPLGYEPRVTLEDGLVELAAWRREQIAEDRVADFSAELAARGLVV